MVKPGKKLLPKEVHADAGGVELLRGGAQMAISRMKADSLLPGWHWESTLVVLSREKTWLPALQALGKPGVPG